MKYLMVWQGVVTGSLGGQSDGFPKQETQIIYSFDDLVKTYREDAQYYKLDPVDVSTAVQAAKDLGL